MLKAMERLQSETCIRFVPLKTRVYKTFIEISNNKKGCFAMIGYHPQKNGQGVPVNLQIPECTNHQGTIEHELLHVIGLLHEQARSDRDQYVKILWENIDRSKCELSRFRHRDHGSVGLLIYRNSYPTLTLNFETSLSQNHLFTNENCSLILAGLYLRPN